MEIGGGGGGGAKRGAREGAGAGARFRPPNAQRALAQIKRARRQAARLAKRALNCPSMPSTARRSRPFEGRGSSSAANQLARPLGARCVRRAPKRLAPAPHLVGHGAGRCQRCCWSLGARSGGRAAAGRGGVRKGVRGVAAAAAGREEAGAFECSGAVRVLITRSKRSWCSSASIYGAPWSARAAFVGVEESRKVLFAPLACTRRCDPLVCQTMPPPRR